MDNLIKEFKNGMSMQELAEKYNISRDEVENIIRAHCRSIKRR
jgi:Mor family transcriptional regulator